MLGHEHAGRVSETSNAGCTDSGSEPIFSTCSVRCTRKGGGCLCAFEYLGSVNI